jgi:DNA-binding transcriptional regulator GbsR (MarR family)
MVGELQDKERDFIEEVGLFFEKKGLPRMAGRMLGWLFIAEPSYQSPSEIAKVLMASKGSVSSSIRLLAQIGMIERYVIPGERHNHFRFQEKNMPGMIQQGPEEEFRMFRKLTDNALELMRNKHSPRQRWLEEMRDLSIFMEKEFPALMERYKNEKAGTNNIDK